jgi:signal transduction histidine kinase
MEEHMVPLGLADRSAERRSSRWGFFGILAAVATISLLHYLTHASYEHWHVVYQRLYYIPILFGAGLYGVRGGVAVAALTGVSYLPHILLQWQHAPLYRSNQLAEIVLFLVFGAVSGFLIDRVNRERERNRETAEQLARANEELRSTFQRLRLLDRLSALGAISAGIAHEIRNPLGGVSGAVEILDSMTTPDDERHEFVQIVKKEIDRISTIVSRQLELVQARPGDVAPCDVGRVIESVVQLLRSQAAKYDIRLETRIAGDLPVVHTDEQGLRQAVLNLVLNGVQATDQSGEVHVAAETRDDTVRIVVDDEGTGLSAEGLEHAFDPFYTTKPKGTGLGLSIAFQIVDQLGGHLMGENRDEGGARFTLELPIESAPPSPGPKSFHESATR